MIEQKIETVYQMLFVALATFFLSGIAILYMSFADVLDFKNYVNYQIQRGGGVTEEVIENIDYYNEVIYNNKFSFQSDYGEVKFGEEVIYKVTYEFEFPFFNYNQTFNFHGASISLAK